ncbi:quinone oxidoreductase family protein [Mycolicibacterium litorale]|uniref:quinone oxidoreductase family protein n=1 Tax=Mycolicibacterium litorale TaxID=758802 RepID=UPI003CF5CC82
MGETPVVTDFDEPQDNAVEVRVAGCNPVDLVLASGRMGEPQIPSVVGKEGVGVTADGTRVYFDSPPSPFGSWAQRCAVDPELTFPVPDGLDDDLAVTLGIAGLAAWLPLTRHADVAGKSVLILGATGVVGQIGVQAAKLLDAAHVVGAGRNREALATAAEMGADATVVLGDGDDAKALRDAAGDGYDVVLDLVYGAPFLAALKATAVGATLVTVGEQAGESADVPFADLVGRTHVGHINNLMPTGEMRAGYEELARHAADGAIRVEIKRYSLDDAPKAWQTQADGPHHKIVVVP